MSDGSYKNSPSLRIRTTGTGTGIGGGKGFSYSSGISLDELGGGLFGECQSNEGSGSPESPGSPVNIAISAAPFYLQVLIVHTGETTKLRVDDLTTILEIIKMVEEKKNTSFSDCLAQFLLMDGSKINIPHEEMTLKNFRQIDKFLIESKSSIAAAALTIQTRRGVPDLLQLGILTSAAVKAGLTREDSDKSINLSPYGTMLRLKGGFKVALAGLSGSRSKLNSADSNLDSRSHSQATPTLYSTPSTSTSVAFPMSPSVQVQSGVHTPPEQQFNQPHTGSMMGTAAKAQVLSKRARSGRFPTVDNIVGSNFDLLASSNYHNNPGSSGGVRSNRNNVLDSSLNSKITDQRLMKSTASLDSVDTFSASTRDNSLERLSLKSPVDQNSNRASLLVDGDKSIRGRSRSKTVAISFSGFKTQLQGKETVPLSPKIPILQENEIPHPVMQSTLEARSQNLRNHTLSASVPNTSGISIGMGECTSDIDLIGDALNAFDLSGLLESEKVITETEFAEIYNPNNGNIWSIPFQGSESNSMTAASQNPGTSEIGQSSYFKFHCLAEPPVFMKVPNATSMENFCRRICMRKGLDYETHSLEWEVKEVRPVEMDQLFGKYGVQQNFNLYLVKKAKVYASITTTENEEETLVSNYIDGKPLITACKKEKIFNIMTSPCFEDEKFMNIVFLTYRNFATGQEFLAHLIRSFYVRLSDTSTDYECETFEKFSTIARLKVLRVLHNWIEHHWHDFGLNSELRALLNAFLNQLCKNEEYAEVSKGILFVADIQRRWFEDLLNSYNTAEKKGKKIDSMLDVVEAEDIAEQLCILNSDLFRNIHPIEFLNEIWKKAGEDPSPSFQFFVDRFNKESYWAATEIINCRDQKNRISALRKFIYIIKCCLELNNFFTAFSLIAGLNLIPVQRLKKTWEGLPEKAKQMWAEVEKVADPSKNMKNYRDRLKVVTPPMVPFLPIYLKDLTFINDGNSAKVKGLVNVDKLRMMANRVQEIVSLGGTLYPFDRKSAMLNWLEKPTIEIDINKLKKLATALEAAV